MPFRSHRFCRQNDDDSGHKNGDPWTLPLSDFLLDLLERRAKQTEDINKKILGQLEKSMFLMEFNQRYLAKFLSTGTLSKRDLLEFYSADDVKDQFRLVEKDIEAL